MLTGEKLGAAIESARIKKGVSKAELARAFGVKPPSIQGWINTGRVSKDKVLALVEYFSDSVPPSHFGIYADFSGDGLRSGPVTRKVPLISWVVAGDYCESPDNYAPGDAEEWLDTPFSTSTKAFCLTLHGDSMSPEYRDGEVILVDPAIAPLHGNDVVARTPDGEHTFKRLQITNEGKYLLALNPDHPKRKIEMPPETVICGVVIGSWMRRR